MARHMATNNRLELTPNLVSIFDQWDDVIHGELGGSLPYSDNGRHRRPEWGVSLVKLSA